MGATARPDTGPDGMRAAWDHGARADRRSGADRRARAHRRTRPNGGSRADRRARSDRRIGRDRLREPAGSTRSTGRQAAPGDTQCQGHLLRVRGRHGAVHGQTARPPCQGPRLIPVRGRQRPECSAPHGPPPSPRARTRPVCPRHACRRSRGRSLAREANPLPDPQPLTLRRQPNISPGDGAKAQVLERRAVHLRI